MTILFSSSSQVPAIYNNGKIITWSAQRFFFIYKFRQIGCDLFTEKAKKKIPFGFILAIFHSFIINLYAFAIAIRMYAKEKYCKIQFIAFHIFISFKAD